ncbi:MAG: hypothetical protein FVQ84_18380 [Planctomycetes bacterium]|nr:hypothetical protein [Planctomycetota bacterium]
MESADADRQAEMPVTAPDGSRRNRRGNGDGASRPTARTGNSGPDAIAASAMCYMNRRGTEPYARWCGRTAGAIPPPTRCAEK